VSYAQAAEIEHSALLTAREVAERLSVTTETVLRWTRHGRLPGFRLPSGALRYRDADLEDWLRERATPRRGSVSHLEDAAQPGKVAAVSHRRRRGEDQHAADPARAGVQARLW
jgi:excisionase family DNA binding protein